MSEEKTKKKIEEKIAQKEKKRSLSRIYNISLSIIFFFFFSCILYLTLGEALRGSANKVITKTNVDSILQELESSEISFETVMNYDWQFENGQAASSNAYVQNSPNNQNAFYFTVSLYNTSRTVLYISPTLEVGEDIYDIKLNSGLPAGKYDAALTYYLLDEGKTVVDTVEMGITIAVEQ